MGIPGEHLCEIFFEGYKGLDHIMVKIVDKTDVSTLVEREGFWA